MNERIAVYVYSEDPISQAGVAAQLRGRPEAYVLDEAAIDQAVVAIVVSDAIDEATVRAVRGIQRGGCPKVVLVASQLDDNSLMLAVETGVAGLLRRQEATPELLAHAVVSAAKGNGTLAPDLVGRLLQQVSRLQHDVLLPRGIGRDGLNDRERDVLRLLADGLGTQEIANKLAYSERTIKNIIHDVTTRLHLRNRSHAVAYAIKTGIV
ncbi:MAG: response regulator transcription factor [Ilumatobacteraceae bacterium]